MRVLIATLGILAVSSCVWPDPYRMEIYQAIPDGPSHDSPVLLDEYTVAMSILSSGLNDDEAYAPYRISLWLMSSGDPADHARINSISADLNGNDIGKISLFDMKSDNPVSTKTDLVDLHTAPCCALMLISNHLDLVHVPDDVLTINTEICLTRSSISECKLVTKSFRAVVKKGVFQITPV